MEIGYTLFTALLLPKSGCSLSITAQSCCNAQHPGNTSPIIVAMTIVSENMLQVINGI